jgi:hypothetical protein
MLVEIPILFRRTARQSGARRSPFLAPSSSRRWMDYKLPDGSGLDAARRVRSKRGDAPIIIISGYEECELHLVPASLAPSGRTVYFEGSQGLKP